MAEPGDFDYVERPCVHPEAYPAERYEPCDELTVITCYFNSANFRTRRDAYDTFADPIRAAGIPLITVECAFGDADFSLPERADTLRVRGRDVMWQKERLINLAIDTLPAHARKVAWLDGDVLFTNPNWAVDTAALLNDYPVVQTFKTAIRLPRGVVAYKGIGEVWNGFGWVSEVVPERMPRHFGYHGHTGFGWAARRELLDKHKLYDACISGSGDHYMAHAMRGELRMRCRGVTASPNMSRHFEKWAEAYHADVAGRIGSTPGTLLHLWHGETKDRSYVDRHDELVRRDFDPDTCLCMGAGGLWEWADTGDDLGQQMIDYFASRKEDGDENEPA